MSTQTEFSSFKQLLKQVYTAHSTKVKELENEIKVLKEKLTEKEREGNSSLSECKRCIHLEEAFKSCQKALLDQSKLFENFGQKFSIFNSPGFENQDLKDVAKSSNDSPENNKKSKNFNNDANAFYKNESSVLSLKENTITEIKINATEKVPVLSNNQSLFKKVMQDDENLESFDVYTVTFPQHLKQGPSTARFDSLIFAPDSLDTSPNAKKVCEKELSDTYLGYCKSKAEFKLDDGENLKDTNRAIENKTSGKRLSSDVLNDDRVKRCNMDKQDNYIQDISKKVEMSSKLSKTKDIKTCNIVPPKILITDEILDIPEQDGKKNTSVMKDVNILDIPVTKKKSRTNKTDDNKIETSKNSNKSKHALNETSPSLLPINANVLPKIIDLEAISNDNEDFEEQISSIKSVSNEDSWETCDKKKSVKKRIAKCIKSTSKFKMTLDAPSLNYKKPTYKQTKLSKSIFQPKNCNSDKKSPNNFVIIEEDSSSTVQDHFQTSTPYGAIKSPCTVDIDATFIPDNFRIENKQCATTKVKKNAVEKSQLKNGSLFSNISFPEELQSVNSEDFIVEENENEDNSLTENTVLKENMNSFDRLPLPEEPAYKYKNDVTKKKSERKQLNGFKCKECEKYYAELGLPDKEKKERLKKCSRHRGKYTPPPTPDHFWELEFPDTQECKVRGYLNETQKVKLNNICNL